MIFLGGVFGALLGFALLTITAAILGFATSLGPLAPIIAALTMASWTVVLVFAIVIIYVFSYTLATIDLLPLIATGLAAPTTPAPPPRPPALPGSPLEGFTRGTMIGMTAALNFGVWSLLAATILPVATFMPALVGLVCFVAVFPFISRNVAYQGVLGWLSWLMPMSWIATTFGLLLFILNLPLAIAAAVAAGAPSPLRFDALTATFETTGGALIGATGFVGGFNLGNFMFVTPGPPPGGRTAFNGLATGVGAVGGLSSHETGHTLNVAALSGVVTWINAIDENIAPFNRNSLAYGELAAESHISRGGVGLGVGPAATAPSVPRQHIALW
jgi:hypothetical protein